MRTKCNTLVRISSVLLIPITLCTMAVTVSARRGLAIDPQSAPSASARLKGNNLASSIGLAKTYRNLPMAMEPNQGQTSKEVKFLSRGRGYGFFLTGKEAVLALHNGQSSFNGQGQSAAKHQTSPRTEILRMKLVGSNPYAEVIGLNKLPGKSNYFIGRDPANWRTNVPNYGKVAERGIYPGIDLIYYGNHQQLEYDFVLAPGANPKSIRLAINGARSLHINSNGDLIVGLENGHLMLHKPEIYQISEGIKEPVSGGFLLQGNYEVAFNIGKYNPSRGLVIDPVLSYSTYLGGSSIDAANGVAVAPDNTAFIAGGTFSSDFPTVHPLQANRGGGPDFPQDAFVAKISADGSTLVYSTYLGGSKTDVANSIAVDSFGNAYLTGTTLSSDFPVTPGSANTLCGGDGKCGASWNPQGLIVSNAFVTKLNVAGSGLVYSSFIGYYENVTGMSIAVDGNGNAYVAGQVGPNLTPTITITPPAQPPPPFPVVGGFQQVFGGGMDGYLVKLDATGSTIPYSTYIGGNGQDTCNAVAVDSSGNAYLTGLTYSENFPISPGVPQSVYGGMGDAFLTKVNPNLIGSSSLVYSTYLGGNGLDQGSGVAVDKSGNAFVAGMTNSTSPSFPVTANVLQPNCALDSLGNCEGDTFVAKMNPSGTALIYSTYLGGTGAEAGVGIALDTNGDAFLTGSTVSTDFPIAGAVFQPKFGGGNADVFVAELNPTGTSLIYSTYLGGTNTDIGTGIAVDSKGSAYVTGQTCSPDFPLANPLQEYSGGNCDAFISKISVLAGIALNPSGLVFPHQSLGTTSKPLTISLTNGNSLVTIGVIATTGDFAQTNNCGTSIPAGGNCTISVTFTPTANGVRKGTLTINDSAPGNPHVVPLTGTTSPVGLSTSNLSFGNQAVGVASPAKAIVVTNNGSTPLTISGILASGDFAATSNCSVPLQPTTNCVISVTYTPSTTGPTIGAVTLSDNAPDSPQVVLLTGTGVFPDFGISASPTSGSTFAGNPSSFALAVAPIFGSTATVSLACSGAPTGSTCSIAPAQLTLDGIHSSSATVTVTTTKRTMAPPGPNYRTPPSIGPVPVLSILWLAAVSIMGTVALLNSKRPRVWAQVGFLAVSMFVWGGCVGDSTKTAGTPAGTYTLTIKGTSGTVTHTSNFTLKIN
jgi:hypothetical protein